MLVVAMAVLVSGCAAARQTDDAARRTSPVAADDPLRQTTMISRTQPPTSTLSYGGRTVRGGLGTRCWAPEGVCADASGTILGNGTLTAPPGATLTFAYGGDRIDTLGAVAYKVGRKKEGGGRIVDGGAVFQPNYEGEEKILKVRRTGTRAGIVADLPAGEYVIDVFATMPEGDVSYGFRLMVGG